MKTEHTPGPWKIDFPTLGKYSAHIVGPQGHHVACIRGNVPASHFKAEIHNARLIASAPALRAALEKMLRIAELADSHHSEDVCEAINHARTALALATQESK